MNVIASIGTAGTLVIEAIGVVVTIVGIWLAGSPERRKRKVRDQRIDDGLFGYREGDTKKPGIFTTVDTIEGDVAVVRDLADAAATLGSDNKTSSSPSRTRWTRPPTWPRWRRTSRRWL